MSKVQSPKSKVEGRKSKVERQRRLPEVLLTPSCQLSGIDFCEQLFARGPRYQNQRKPYLTMKFEEFKESIQNDAQPPTDLSPCLRALWHDAKGDWDAAHQIAQDVEDSDGAWVHAYLHRKERDLSNARYWYHRSGRPEFRGTLDKEWEQIVRALLA